ncbi:MAG: dUTP diphosphatase [Rhodospirillaceae bacterium]|nr:dUTP diphosphatase [Rhodospirillaceae bacterium]
MVSVAIKRLPHNLGLPLPEYETLASAGMDLPAAIKSDLIIAPGERILVPTGLALALPEGYEAQIRPRSGLALRNGITVLNTPGTVDSDYRGEVKVILVNFSNCDFTIQRGMRIAQIVIAPILQVSLTDMEVLPKTARGEGGFGSTGTTT